MTIRFEMNDFFKILTSAPKNMNKSSLDERLSADLRFTTPFIPPNLPFIFWLRFSTSKQIDNQYFYK